MLDESKLSLICGHYKDVIEAHDRNLKLRDSLFLWTLILLSLFYAQAFADELFQELVRGYLQKEFGTPNDLKMGFLSILLWMLLFGVSTRYFQVVVNIEREYDYIHGLEKLMNANFDETNVFTKEGESYKRDYPLFSNWIWALYTIAFPCLLFAILVFRINKDFTALYRANPAGLLVAFACCILIGTSTILYMGKLHYSSSKKYLKKLWNHRVRRRTPNSIQPHANHTRLATPVE